MSAVSCLLVVCVCAPAAGDCEKSAKCNWSGCMPSALARCSNTQPTPTSKDNSSNHRDPASLELCGCVFFVGTYQDNRNPTPKQRHIHVHLAASALSWFLRMGDRGYNSPAFTAFLGEAAYNRRCPDARLPPLVPASDIWPPCFFLMNSVNSTHTLSFLKITAPPLVETPWQSKRPAAGSFSRPCAGGRSRQRLCRESCQANQEKLGTAFQVKSPSRCSRP